MSFSISSCRILGFRRAPLVVGRIMNLRIEIKPVATDQLLSTFLMHGQFHPDSLLLCVLSVEMIPPYSFSITFSHFPSLIWNHYLHFWYKKDISCLENCSAVHICWCHDISVVHKIPMQFDKSQYHFWGHSRNWNASLCIYLSLSYSSQSTFLLATVMCLNIEPVLNTIVYVARHKKNKNKIWSMSHTSPLMIPCIKSGPLWRFFWPKTAHLTACKTTNHTFV